MDAVPGGVEAMLSAASWTPGRRVGVTNVVDTLRSVGFEVPEAATEFLSQFAFLHLKHEPSILLDGERSYCWTRFDPTAVATMRDVRIARRCAEIAGRSLCPVDTDGFHFTVYIAADSTFFAGRDASVFRYASSPSELLTSMRDGERPVHLGDWSLE